MGYANPNAVTQIANGVSTQMGIWLLKQLGSVPRWVLRSILSCYIQWKTDLQPCTPARACFLAELHSMTRSTSKYLLFVLPTGSLADDRRSDVDKQGTKSSLAVNGEKSTPPDRKVNRMVLARQHEWSARERLQLLRSAGTLQISRSLVSKLSAISRSIAATP